MQAVILAGGLGTRLWPLTKEVPKPMVPVAGKPYLEHQIAELKRQGADRILLLTAYLGEQIENHFGDGSGFGLSIEYSREPEPMGTGGALKLAREKLADAFLLLYGDSFLPIDYAAVYGRLVADPAAEGVVVVYDNRDGDTSVPNNIALREDAAASHAWVARYDKTKTPDPELTHVEAGVLAFRRAVIDEIPPGKVSLEQEIFPRLIARGSLAAFPTRERFYDIGTPERLARIEEYFRP